MASNVGEKLLSFAKVSLKRSKKPRREISSGGEGAFGISLCTKLVSYLSFITAISAAKSGDRFITNLRAQEIFLCQEHLYQSAATPNSLVKGGGDN